MRRQIIHKKEIKRPIAKTKLLWIVNLCFFTAVVFLGIEQAGRGAEIAKLERDAQTLSEEKRNLAEGIFKETSGVKTESLAQEMGFVKPTTIYYFNTEDVFAKLPVR